MALKKQKINNKGVSYEYWIAQPILNSEKKKTTVTMLGYLSEDARRNGSTFIERVRIPGELEGVENSLSDIYAFAKRSIVSEEVEGEEGVETNFFADAEDC